MSLKLVRFLMRLAGESVVVELKNGTVVAGVVVGVDVSMNMHLRSVKLSVRHANPVQLDSLSVRGSTVRYVLLPDALNLDQLLQEQLSRHSKQQQQLQQAEQAGGAAAGANVRGGRGRGRGRGRGGERGGRGRGRGGGDRGGGRGRLD